MHRVRFDGNKPGASPFWLTTIAAREDLKRIEADLCEGLHIVIVDPGELEGEAILRYNAERDRWEAHLIPGTLKNLY